MSVVENQEASHAAGTASVTMRATARAMSLEAEARRTQQLEALQAKLDGLPGFPLGGTRLKRGGVTRVAADGGAPGGRAARGQSGVQGRRFREADGDTRIVAELVEAVKQVSAR